MHPSGSNRAQDWSAVQWSEVADSLREAEWTESAPRPAREFLGGRFGVPSSAKKLVSRIKCNAWFYRANVRAWERAKQKEAPPFF